MKANAWRLDTIFETLYQICKVNKINMCTMFILVMYFLLYYFYFMYFLLYSNARVHGKGLSSVFYQGILCVAQ